MERKDVPSGTRTGVRDCFEAVKNLERSNHNEVHSIIHLQYRNMQAARSPDGLSLGGLRQQYSPLSHAAVFRHFPREGERFQIFKSACKSCLAAWLAKGFVGKGAVEDSCKKV